MWSYCQKLEGASSIQCMDLWYQSHFKSLGCSIELLTSLGSQTTFYNSTLVPDFRYRTWNHFCWTFNKGTFRNHLYINGVIKSSFKTPWNGFEASSDDRDEAAFTVGQDPDFPDVKGNFNKQESFIGNIAELKLWDKVLTPDQILKIASCKNFSRGNLIAWEEDNFDIFNGTVTSIRDLTSLCRLQKRMFLLPEKRRYREALQVCATCSHLPMRRRTIRPLRWPVTIATPAWTPARKAWCGLDLWHRIRPSSRGWVTET